MSKVRIATIGPATGSDGLARSEKNPRYGRERTAAQRPAPPVTTSAAWRKPIAILHEKAIRGSTKTGWLDSKHTFSFGHFKDPARMGHRALRVINEDIVIPGAGFGEHEHQNMDIISYVISGALKHADSMGNTSVICAGEFQHMYAGSGVTHLERNASDTDPVHFLQIWIIPETTGDDPAYFQTAADLDQRRNVFVPFAGPEPREGQAQLRSDTTISLARLDDGVKGRGRFCAGPGRISSGCCGPCGNRRATAFRR